MEAQDFINSSNFELADDIVIEPIDPDTVTNVMDGNIKFGDFVSLEALNGLSESSAISDGSNSTRFPSYQIVNEAAVATAGNMPTLSAMASTVNNTLGIQEPSIEFLKQTAKFREDTNFDLTEETKQQIEDAQKTWATGTLAIANTSEKANGGFKFSTSGAWDVGANVITINSDGTMHWNSPIMSSVTTTTLQQSKAHFVTTDLKKTDTKNKYEHIEKTSTSIKSDDMSVTINTSTDVANNKDVKAVARHTVTTAESYVNAADVIDYNSEKDTRITAKRAANIQSNTIALTASKGAKVPTAGEQLNEGVEGQSIVNEDGTTDLVVKDAAGNISTFTNVDNSAEALAIPKWEKFPPSLEGRQPGESEPGGVREGQGALSITADTELTMIANDSVLSSQASQVFLAGANTLMSAQGGMTQIAKSMAMSGEDAVQMLSKSGSIISTSGGTSLIVQSGQTFIGQRAVSFTPLPSLTQAKPIEVRSVPRLPDLPRSLTADDLEKCIPDKFKPNLETSEEESPESGNAPTAEEAGQRDKQHPIPGGKDSSSVTETNLGQGDDNTSIQDSEQSDLRGNKLPNVSPLSESSSPTNPSNVVTPDRLLAAASVVEGGTDIFPADQDEEQDTYSRTPQNLIAPDIEHDTQSVLNDQGDLAELSDESRATLERKVEQFNNALEDILQPRRLRAIGEELSLTEETIVIILEPESINLISNSIERDFLDKKLSSDVLSRLQEFNTQPGVPELIDEVKSILFGQLGIGNGLIQFANKAYKKVQDGINIVNSTIDDISESEVGRIAKSAKEYAKFLPGQAGELVGEVGSGINAILNSDIQTSIEFLTANSSSLNEIYSTLKNVVQDKGVLSQTIDTLGGNKLRESLNSALRNVTDIGLTDLLAADGSSIIDFDDTKVEAAANTFLSAMLNLRNDSQFAESGFTTEGINNVIEDIFGSSAVARLSRTAIQDVLNDGDVRKVWGDILNSNVEDFVTGSALENLLPYVVGNQNAALFTKLKGLYFSGKDIFNDVLNTFDDAKGTVQDTIDTGKQLYTSLKAIPAMISLMNQYRMPVLNQVQTLLSCLDLLNQFKQLWDDVKSVIDTVSNFADPLKDTINTLNDLFDLLNISDESDQSNPDNLTRDLLDLISEGNVNSTVSPYITEPSSNTSQVTNLGEINQETSLADSVDYAARVNNILTADSCGSIIFSASRDANHSPDPSQWIDSITDDQIIKIIETLPRLTQVYNSINEFPLIQPGNLNNPLTFNNLLNEDQIRDIQNTRINVPLDNCYVAPRLNLVESLVQVNQISNNNMLFKMSNLDLLKFNGKNVLPNNNTIIQIYVEEFRNVKTGQVLKVHRRREFFTPYVYNFKVIEFKANRNIGIAKLIPTQTRIYLQSITGVVSSYGSSDIGNRLEPLILDSYVLL